MTADLLSRLRDGADRMEKCFAPLKIQEAADIREAADKIAELERERDEQKAAAEHLFIKEHGEIGYVGIRDYAAAYERAEAAEARVRELEAALRAERERCAKAVDYLAGYDGTREAISAFMAAASAIRALPDPAQEQSDG